MDTEKDHFQEDADFQEVLGRFEEMIENEQSSFFDVYDFERIIDHYLDRNHFSKAIHAVRMGMVQHPGSVTLMIKEAQVYAEKGDSQQALDMVDSLERLEQSNAEVFMLKGMILNQMGKAGEAENAFRTALESNFDNEADLLYDIALSFEYVNQFRLAARYLEKAIKKYPGKLNILYELAYCHDRLHDFEKSIQYYEAYLDREPYEENVWYNLGLVFFKKEDFRKAVECYDFAIAINDEYAMAVFNKANALANLEEYEEAIKAYKECILIEPENVLAHCYLGESLEKLENYREATEWYERATHIDPSFSEAWYGIAVCYLFRKLYPDSLFYVNKAISLDGENPDYWFTLGNVQAQLNAHGEAVKAYSRATELDPNDDEAWINLAKLEQKQGRTDKAIQVLKDSYSHTFDIFTVNYCLAGYYHLKGDLAQALSFFEKGLDLDYTQYGMVDKISPDLLKERAVRELLEKHNLSKNK